MDEKRILAKIDELDSYLNELENIAPKTREDYVSSLKEKRACERLFQISIESVIDICNIFISDLKLGLPSDEGDVLKKLSAKKIISKKMHSILESMKGFRNILVHKYGSVDDELVFENLGRLSDFTDFKEEIINFLNKK